MKSPANLSNIGLEGALPVLAALPFVFAFSEKKIFDSPYQLVTASLATITCLISALTLFRKPVAGKFFAIIASISCYASLFIYISTNPFFALAATTILISTIFLISGFQLAFTKKRKNIRIENAKQRALWATASIPILTACHLIFDSDKTLFAPYALTSAFFIAMAFYGYWAYKSESKKHTVLLLIIFTVLILSFYTTAFTYLPYSLLFLSILMILSFPREKQLFEKKEHWWEVLINRPAHILISTFLALCMTGTFLLYLPASAKDGSIKFIDAAFTSVSAVCVTGLTTLDTSKDFTLFGQVCIILLIQLGGLGIMGIATIAMHAMGRRLSLKQEQILTSLTDTDHNDLFYYLKTILKFTFIVEGLGAIILSSLFYNKGAPFATAVWHGLFTSISAFCNAGFALQSSSLIPYQTIPLALHTVAALIILGGIAPTTTLLIPKWLSGKPVPIAARIPLVITTLLLVSGTIFIAIFEWNGALSGLSITDKIHNAWFQSATLRTAGFNSVVLSGIKASTFLIMLVLMFVGGSPGGTAGGIKTTTLGILLMTFWTNINNKRDITFQNRRINSSTVYRAVTIVTAGIIVWFTALLMLITTQEISAKDLIFETTSAIATVGLSIGATPLLDEIGKIIIIVAMFLGRIGPMTLFTLLSEEHSVSASRYPEAKISLT